MSQDVVIHSMQERFKALAEIVKDFEISTGKSIDLLRYNAEPNAPEFFVSFKLPAACRKSEGSAEQSNSPITEDMESRYPALFGKQ